MKQHPLLAVGIGVGWLRYLLARLCIAGDRGG